MRNRRLRVLCGLIAVLAISAALRAQEQPTAPPTAPSAAVPTDDETAAQKDTPDPAPDAPAAGSEANPPGGDTKEGAPTPGAPAASTPAADDDDAAGPPGKAPTGKSPARFEPTEKVRADFDVSFPVDI